MPFLSNDDTQEPVRMSDLSNSAAGLSLLVLLSSRLYSIAWRVWRHLFLLTFFCCACSWIHGQTPAIRRVVVSAGAACSVRKDKVVLEDVATIAGDPESADRLRMISLGYAPDVGLFRELSREKISMAITAAGFAGSAVRLELPPVITIHRESQVVNPAIIRAAVERVVLTNLQAKGALARLVKLDLPERIEAPTGQVEARASLGPARNIFDQFIVSISIWIDGRLARRVTGVGQVEARAPVMVARHNLAARTRLREADFSIEIRKLDQDISLYITEAAQLRGVSTLRALSDGEPITTDAITRDIVVKVGDTVRINGESSALKITVNGEARAAGHVGDRIQVKNLQSGQLLQAVVVDEGVVSVRF
jgi:flagella basal body P-ring formation protein FlgA